jgi:hypothetical protein
MAHEYEGNMVNEFEMHPTNPKEYELKPAREHFLVKGRALRTRIEFSDLDSANAHQYREGGWVVMTERTRQVFWYDHNYTRSEIFKELPGYIEIS